MFAFGDFDMILSYCRPKSKQKKVVLLRSTMHPKGDKLNSTYISENVNFYNTNKTRRWPFKMFNNPLDSVGINSNIRCQGSSAKENENTSNTRMYLKTLAIELITPLMKPRLQIPTLFAELRAVIQRILNFESESNLPIPKLPWSGGSSFSPRRKVRKSQITCKKCNKLMFRASNQSLPSALTVTQNW